RTPCGSKTCCIPPRSSRSASMSSRSSGSSSRGSSSRSSSAMGSIILPQRERREALRVLDARSGPPFLRDAPDHVLPVGERAELRLVTSERSELEVDRLGDVDDRLTLLRREPHGRYLERLQTLVEE